MKAYKIDMRSLNIEGREIIIRYALKLGYSGSQWCSEDYFLFLNADGAIGSSSSVDQYTRAEHAHIYLHEFLDLPIPEKNLSDFKLAISGLSMHDKEILTERLCSLGYVTSSRLPTSSSYIYARRGAIHGGIDMRPYLASPLPQKNVSDFLPSLAKEVEGPKLEDLSISDLAVLEKEFEDYLSRDMERFYLEVRRVKRDKIGEIYPSTLKRLNKE